MDKSLFNIFKVFLKVGSILLGGGYVILPILQKELVDKRRWIEDDELCEYYALGQSVPGIIAANMSIFVGYKLRKFWGAFWAILGITLPAFVAIVILANILTLVTHLKFIQSIFWGVGVGVLTLIFLAVQEMWKKSIVNRRTGWMFLISFLCSAFFKVSPAIIITIAILLAVSVAYTQIDENEIITEEEIQEEDINKTKGEE